MRQETIDMLTRCAQRMKNEFGQSAGPRIMRVLYEELGGFRISIPTILTIGKYYNTEARDNHIRSQFVGDNYHELSEITGLSVRQIRRIIDNERDNQ